MTLPPVPESVTERLKAIAVDPFASGDSPATDKLSSVMINSPEPHRCYLHMQDHARRLERRAIALDAAIREAERYWIARNEELKARLEGMEQDARRYRWVLYNMNSAGLILFEATNPDTEKLMPAWTTADDYVNNEIDAALTPPRGEEG